MNTLEKKSQDLISYLDGTLSNVERVLFSGFDEPDKVIELRTDLSARRIAKLYGFTQKLLTKHIDQLGLGAKDEVKAIRKALVHRCNFILDKLEEKNEHSGSGTNGSASWPERKETESIHNIIVAHGVVYGNIYLSGQKVTLYVPPMPASSEHSHFLFDGESCQCQDNSSRFLTFLEHVITTVQQRLLDDGILEYPSRAYNVCSYEMVLARTSMQRRADVAIPLIPLLATTATSEAPPPPARATLFHPHEAAAASLQSRVIGDGQSEENTLRLLLSLEGTYCHASLVAFRNPGGGGSDKSCSESHVTLFQDKFRVKIDSKSESRVAQSKTAGTFQEKGFVVTAPLFASRLETEVQRALHMRGQASGNWKWRDIRSVHFLGDEAIQPAVEGGTPDAALRAWLEAPLLASISEQRVADVKAVVSYADPHVIDDARHLLCAAANDTSELTPHHPSPLSLGSAVGVRVENFTPTITAKAETTAGSESTVAETCHCESNELIPFLEPFQQVPVSVRRRLRGARSPNLNAETLDLVLDVVEERRCSSGGQSSKSCGCCGLKSFGNSGRFAQSLLCGIVTVNNSTSGENKLPVCNIDLEVEISVDVDRNVSLRVIDVNNDEANVAITTSSAPDPSQVNVAGASPMLHSIRRIFSPEDRCVRELDHASRWSCADLAADFKQRGNVYMKRGDYAGAIEMYTIGLTCAPSGEPSGVLASNRCAVFTHMNHLPAALEDAQECVRHCPTWEKGWARLGSVLYRLKRLEESLHAYEKATSLAPTNCNILDALQEVRDVVMVRKAEEAAMEAKGHTSNKRKSEGESVENDSKKECNDVCTIC